MGDRCIGESGDEKRAQIGEWSTPKDMTRWAGCLTFDIMGDICFSHRSACLKKKTVAIS